MLGSGKLRAARAPGTCTVTAPVLETPLRPAELLDRCAAACSRLNAQVAEVVIGQEQVIEQLLLGLFSRGHCLLVGVPGLAKTLLVSTLAKILDLSDPTAKMSKSRPDAGTVYLSDDAAVISRKIKRAVTDTDNEIRFDPEHKAGLSNLMSIYACITNVSTADVEKEFSGQGYGALKQAVADAVIAFAQPFAARTAELLADPAELDRILARGRRCRRRQNA